MPRPDEAPYAQRFLSESARILGSTDVGDVEAVAEVLCRTRDRGGRVFFCGSGGGAAHASHATGDARKIAAIEAYSVSDNVSELTARTNDEGWDTAYADWLHASRLAPADCLFVFSVGGGDRERNISVNLVSAMQLARDTGAAIVGIVGRDGGLLKQWAEACIHISTNEPDQVTAQTEGLQSVFWHLLVTHPRLMASRPKWESAAP